MSKRWHISIIGDNGRVSVGAEFPADDAADIFGMLGRAAAVGAEAHAEGDPIAEVVARIAEDLGASVDLGDVEDLNDAVHVCGWCGAVKAAPDMPCSNCLQSGAPPAV